MDDLAVARIARRAAVASEFLALKARRCLAEQSQENFDDFVQAHRSMQEAITRNYIDMQVETGEQNAEVLQD